MTTAQVNSIVTAQESQAEALRRDGDLQPDRRKSTIRLMTVAIAVACENRKAAVLMADRKISFTSLPMGFELDRPKFGKISDRAMIAVSGSLEHLTRITRSLGPIQQLALADVAKRIEGIYIGLRDEAVHAAVHNILGCDLAEYRRLLFSSTVAPQQTIDAISKLRLGLQVILIGAENGDCKIYGIGEQGVIDHNDCGFHCIGSGAVNAILVLGAYGYSPERPMADALYAAFNAKRTAEFADGVGASTDIAILDKRGKIRNLPPTVQRLLDTIRKNHRLVTPSERRQIRRAIGQ